MRTKGATNQYRKGWDRVFVEKEKVIPEMFRMKVWTDKFGQPSKEEIDEYIKTGAIRDRT